MRRADHPGPFYCCVGGQEEEGAARVVLALREAALDGDLPRLISLLGSRARDRVCRLVRLRGAAALSALLRRRGRRACDCRVQRILALPDGTFECRLLLFVLLPGGHIRSCFWLAQACLEGGAWKVVDFDRLPGAGPV